MRRLRQSTLVLVLCLAFLAGLGLARRGYTTAIIWVWLSAFIALLTFRKRNFVTLLFVVAFGLLFGLSRGQLYVQKFASYDQYFYQKVTIAGVAGEDATYDRYKQLTFDSHNITVTETGETLTGKVGVSGFGVPAVYAGESFTATGKLYPSRGSYQAKIKFAELMITSVDKSIVNQLRRNFAAGMQSALPEPLASFGMGLLIGQRANLPDETYNALLMVGLVHIIAVSGYNLTIILRATEGTLKKRSKRLSLIMSLSLIGLFLLFAGASASIVRAAVVSVLAIAAGYYGRSVKPLVLILLAAALTSWANPFYLWSDIGWYLSFLAFFGVMIIAPLVMARLPNRYAGSLVVAVAVESLCAEIMTLPYVLHIFGQMSFVSLLANVLVVALVPLAMLLCLFAGLSGMLVPALAGYIAFPAKLLLTYMLDVADLLSRIPHVFVQGLSLPLTQLLLLYGLAGFLAYVLYQKTKPALRDKITEKKQPET
ncbi:ComEC/Rec2 family competence protein [Candidatus Saccharibacteria bacterium]|nr:ComEC/Rec2 family competence protein [Candidatus Saccharibacteria bacterium]